MPRPSIIATLPSELRDELTRRIVASAFADIASHSRWLGERGFPCCKSSVGRYSLKLKRRQFLTGDVLPALELAFNTLRSAIEVLEAGRPPKAPVSHSNEEEASVDERL